MGVINLSVLIEKIKRKLLTAGFITSKDKASKSAFGIVKIGDNISASSGKISVPLGTTENPGVLQVGSGLSVEDGIVSASASGGVADVLFHGNISLGSNVNYDLSHPYTDYNSIVFVKADESLGIQYSGGVLSTAYMYDTTEKTYNSINFTFCDAPSTNIQIRIVDSTHFKAPSGSGTISGLTIIGIK